MRRVFLNPLVCLLKRLVAALGLRDLVILRVGHGKMGYDEEEDDVFHKAVTAAVRVASVGSG